MYKKFIAIAVLTAITSISYAGTNKETGEVCQGSDCSGTGGGTGGTGGTGGIVVTDGFNSTSNSAAGAASFAISNSNSSVGNTTSNSSVGNTTSNSSVGNTTGGTSNSTLNYKSSRQVPGAYAPSVQPTIPCAIPINAGGSSVSIGLSFGSAYVDKECEIRELIRLGMEANDETFALANKLLQQKLNEALQSAAESSKPAEPYKFPDY